MDKLNRLALSLPSYGPINPGGVPGTTDPDKLANFAIYLITAIGVVAAVAFIIYSGFLWTTSGGDKQKLEQARATLTYAIIGLVVILLSFAIIRLIVSLLGIPKIL